MGSIYPGVHSRVNMPLQPSGFWREGTRFGEFLICAYVVRQDCDPPGARPGGPSSGMPVLS